MNRFRAIQRKADHVHREARLQVRTEGAKGLLLMQEILDKTNPRTRRGLVALGIRRKLFVTCQVCWNRVRQAYPDVRVWGGHRNGKEEQRSHESRGLTTEALPARCAHSSNLTVTGTEGKATFQLPAPAATWRREPQEQSSRTGDSYCFPLHSGDPNRS
jgi:hypothetical protein